MLRMVRFGVVDSMEREVRSIALQNLLARHSPQTQTLLEEVCVSLSIFIASIILLFSFSRFVHTEKENGGKD